MPALRKMDDIETSGLLGCRVMQCGRKELMSLCELSVFACRMVRGSVVVKALCYKPEGRGFETR
jgi:hypothetical protein